MSLYISKANQCKFIVATLNVTLITENPVDGDSSGQIIVSVSGGQRPYLYSINRGLNQSSNQFDGLNAGYYLIQVVDKFGNIGYASTRLFDNVVCGDYNGSTLQDIIDTGLPLGSFLNCTLQDFL
jgi:hypothetical protein